MVFLLCLNLLNDCFLTFSPLCFLTCLHRHLHWAHAYRISGWVSLNLSCYSRFFDVCGVFCGCVNLSIVTHLVKLYHCLAKCTVEPSWLVLTGLVSAPFCISLGFGINEHLLDALVLSCLRRRKHAVNLMFGDDWLDCITFIAFELQKFFLCDSRLIRAKCMFVEGCGLVLKTTLGGLRVHWVWWIGVAKKSDFFSLARKDSNNVLILLRRFLIVFVVNKNLLLTYHVHSTWPNNWDFDLVWNLRLRCNLLLFPLLLRSYLELLDHLRWHLISLGRFLFKGTLSASSWWKHRQVCNFSLSSDRDRPISFTVICEIAFLKNIVAWFEILLSLASLVTDFG